MAKSKKREPETAKETDSVQLLIDQNLRKVYGKTLLEDIPDRFSQLLDQLRAKSGAK
ncbi:NepR family anti-sigma factor [Pseudorhodobacter sp.]|uniref:NepR family anti-sigma factor n=1 Tax=Pseudorhodobacter sp. TaxID=1934400 RepID=UPI0026495C8F|nr:NepR family anti-sigma factor [Pseudorhodobacter sp.]MDN5787475.1 RNA polymerase subunit sigma-70 [Pseudorhodobacter sp.]